MAESASELQAEIEKLERKHAEHPEGRYFVPLANAYRKLGDVSQAEALLGEGLRRHPDYLSAHIVLGRCLADRNATREAEEEFRYVLSLDPQNLIALRTLGELAAGDGQTDDAERWYDELLAVDPMNEEARRALDSIRGSESGPRADEEFRPGAAWWEREPEDVIALDQEPMPADLSVDEAPILEALPDEGTAEVLLDDEPGEDALPDESDQEEVVTETIAELYARQGFHERSADVFRELIRRRGGDPTLQHRLAEIEQMIAGAAPPETPEPVPPSDSDSFADSFEGGFYSGAEEPEPAVPGETIADYLRALIGWSVAPPASVAFPTLAPEPELEPEPEPVASVPEPIPEPVEEPVIDLLPEITEFAPPPPPPVAEPSAPEPSAPGEVGRGMGPADVDLFPWEVPSAALPEPLPGFDAFFSDSVEEQPPLPEPAVFSDRESVPEAEPAPEPTPAPAPAEEEDEDLESFQAWLRSLKR